VVRILTLDTYITGMSSERKNGIIR